MVPRVKRKFGMSLPRIPKRLPSKVKNYWRNAKGRVLRRSRRSKLMICLRPEKNVRLLFAFA